VSLRPVIVVADDLSGFCTAEAATGMEALALTRSLLPDVLLTDLSLPDMDGAAVAALVMHDARTAGVSVILLAGRARQDLERRAALAGTFRTLLKPCLPRTMLGEGRRALERREPVTRSA
jgi:two-component system, cell cycle response regulator DivK